MTRNAMPKKLWIHESLNEKQKSSELLREFLYDFYTELEKKISNMSIGEGGETKSHVYKNSVFDLLIEHKLSYTNTNLSELQMQIENLSMKFDENSIYKGVPNLIRILIQKDRKSAKEYLFDKLPNGDHEMLEEFGQYTLEALIIHVLGILFNSTENEIMVRASSLIDQLDNTVRTHSKLLKSHYSKKVNVDMSDTKKKDLSFSFGAHLLEFMTERGLVSSITIDSPSRVVKKKAKGGYFVPSNLFIVCKFDISLLPIKLNLPMICQPLDWTSNCPDDQSPRYLSDLSGGYLSGPTGEIYDRYRLLSSGDLKHFYIYIGDEYQYFKNSWKSLCNVMNALQCQAFTINHDWLMHLLDFEESFVDNGLLMPRFLESLNIQKVYKFLRDFHMKNDKIYNEFSFSELLNLVIKSIQRSRYERLILNLAKAYDGYQFYLPAFLDFRGRIYRSGILHFHERDLARSLIIFADRSKSSFIDESYNYEIAGLATVFHFQSFNSIENACEYLHNNINNICENLFSYAIKAKRPFQFYANILALKESQMGILKDYVPITQDAASSAYQIMSYFLLDETMAERTNLFLNPYNQINDIYLFFLEELKEFLKAELEDNLCSVVCKHINRKIVKGIFMPIIYGKTLMSTSTDLIEHFSQHLTRMECFKLASVCFKFFKEKYPGMECLIRLIRNIGWVASARDSAVLYNVSYYTTVQDYMKTDPIYIWVYDRIHKKRRRVNLRVSSDKRDRRKTVTSTFVNFIHQKDAFIAMKVVEEMLHLNAPIYTVHDNFITTPGYSKYISIAYVNVFSRLGPPLSIINKFIYMNVIHHLRFRCNHMEFDFEKYDFEKNVIPKKYLTSFLYGNIPENISKQNRILWEKKISEIVTCYTDYVQKVCGESHTTYHDSWESHENKWKKFSSRLHFNNNEICPSFCVHY